MNVAFALIDGGNHLAARQPFELREKEVRQLEEDEIRQLGDEGEVEVGAELRALQHHSRAVLTAMISFNTSDPKHVECRVCDGVFHDKCVKRTFGAGTFVCYWCNPWRAASASSSSCLPAQITPPRPSPGPHPCLA